MNDGSAIDKLNEIIEKRNRDTYRRAMLAFDWMEKTLIKAVVDGEQSSDDIDNLRMSLAIIDNGREAIRKETA